MSPFAPRMVVWANVLYTAFVSLPTRGPVSLKRLLVRSLCLSFYYFLVYIIARSKSTYKARFSHFADEASGGITSSADGTCADSLDEEKRDEVEEQAKEEEEEEEEEDEEEEIGKCPLRRFKQEENGHSSLFA